MLDKKSRLLTLKKAFLFFASSVFTASLLTSIPAFAANAACAANGYTSGSLTVTPSHGKTFYIDTGVSPRIDASYVGYRITSTSAFSGWVSLTDFTGGVVSLANPQDQYRQLPDISANQTVTVYFLLKAGTSTRTAQTHTLKVFPSRPDISGATPSLTCDFSFTRVAETIKAAANKVTAISVGGDGTPDLGELITVTAEGATGTIGAGSADAGRILWFSPAAFSSFPVSSLRLESVTLVVSDNNQISGNGNNEVRYYKERLLVTPSILPDSEASTNDEDLTADTLVGKRYYRNVYKFRVVGKTTANVQMQPIAQISSGTQIKHTDLATLPTGSGTTINTSSTTISATVTKSVRSTTGLTVAGGYIEVPYRITIDNTASSGSIVIDEIVDTPAPNVTYKSGSTTVTGTTWSGNPVQLSSESSMSPQPWHFVGPFTVAYNTNVVIDYTMLIPDNTNTNYSNNAVAYVGDQRIGSGESTYSTVAVTVSGGTVTGAVATNATFTPEVITLPATSVATTTATLNGTVDPNSSSSAVATGFHWSTSSTLSSYETLTVTASLTGTSPTAQTKAFTGTPGTTYYYRIYATSSGGTSYLGEIVSFTLLENPSTPTVATVAATSITSTTAVLNGSIDPNLRTVSQVRFVYGTSSTLTSPTPTTTILYEVDENGANTTTPVSLAGSSPTDVSLDISSLTNNTTYYFRVSITYIDANSASQTLNGDILNFTAFNRGTTAQTITFNSISTKEFGASTFSAGATASSGLTVNYVSETPSVCTVSSDGTITIVGAGICSITASQPGNSTYAPATDVTQQFEVTPRALTITADSKTKNYGATDPSFTFSISAGPLVGSDTITSTTLTFRSTDSYGYGPSTTVPLDAGTYSITPSVAVFGTGSSSNYTITYVAGSYTINRVNQATFTLNSTSVSINSNTTLNTSGGSGDGIITFVVANAGATGCTVSGSTLTTTSSTGTCSVTATKAETRNYFVATDTEDFIVNSLQSQTINYPGLGDQTWSANLLTDTATATSGLTVTLTSQTPSVCTVSGFSITMLKVGTCTLQADQSGDATYNPAPAVTRSFNITGATRTIALKSKNDGASFTTSYDPTGYLNWGLTPPLLKSLADFDDNDSKTYSLGTGSSGCTVSSAGNVSFTGAGTCIVKVTIAAGDRYQSATSSDASFVIGKKDQVITFIALNSMTVGDSDQNLSATTDASGLSVTFTVNNSSTSICSIVAGKVRANSAGDCRIDANQSGNSDYNPAPQESRTFVITGGGSSSGGGGGGGGGGAPTPPPPPAITSLSRSQVCAISNDITIFGVNLDGASVKLNGVEITVKASSTSALVVTLPSGTIGSKVITVSTSSGSTTATINYVTASKPKFQPIRIPYLSQGVEVNLDIIADHATSFRLQGRLPSGITFNSTTGLISGIPTDNGVFVLDLAAIGPCGETTTVLELDVDAPTPNAISHRINFLPGSCEISESAKESFLRFIEKVKGISPRNIIPDIYISGGYKESDPNGPLAQCRQEALCGVLLVEDLLGEVLTDVFSGNENRIEIIVYWERPTDDEI